MDILRFINSKDIREHLKNIGYSFSSLEAAWLIYQSRGTTIKERHEAWSELIDTMPDCRIEERHNTASQESLHGFLKRYMALEDRFVEEFFDDHGGECVYRIEYSYGTWYTDDLGMVFSSMDKLLKYAEKPKDHVRYVRCYKYLKDGQGKPDIIRLSPKFELLKIEPKGLTGDENDVFYGVFEGLWFDFPTPFKKGDILIDKWQNKMIGTDGGAFVNCGINLESVENERVRENVRIDGDSTDMTFRGYYADQNIGVYYDCHWNYMDLEYYRGELDGHLRMLKPFSSFVKGEIDEALLCRAYYKLRLDECAKQAMPGDITDEGLKLAGLI